MADLMVSSSVRLHGEVAQLVSNVFQVALLWYVSMPGMCSLEHHCHMGSSYTRLISTGYPVACRIYKKTIMLQRSVHILYRYGADMVTDKLTGIMTYMVTDMMTHMMTDIMAYMVTYMMTYIMTDLVIDMIER